MSKEKKNHATRNILTLGSCQYMNDEFEEIVHVILNVLMKLSQLHRKWRTFEMKNPGDLFQ